MYYAVRATFGGYASSSTSSSYYDSEGEDDAPLCEGVTLDSYACRQVAKPQYRFCCALHDPTSVRRSFAPHMFTQNGMRAAKEDKLLQLDGGDDYYRTNSALPMDPDAFQLDHILELQCFALAFNAVGDARRRRRGASVQPLLQLKALVREEVADSNENMCLTRTGTNRLKGAAVWKFLDDSATGHRGTRCLYSYLSREQLTDSGVTLRRSEMRSICRHMGAALCLCQGSLDAAWGMPREARCELNRELDQLYEDMALGC